jgi:plastocyanin
MTRATAFLFLLLTGAAAARAAAVIVSVTDAKDRPVDQVVVVLEPAGGERTGTASRGIGSGQRAVIDQRSLRFVPEISVVRTGTAIEFPNSDQVQHQVYSFSSAKNFKLALYAGHVYPPLVFDRPGLVTLGCNIHDSMIGFVYVTDSPWFGKTGAQGRIEIASVPPGEYRVHLWHPRFAPDEAQIERSLSVAAAGNATLSVSLKRPMQPAPGNNPSQKWKSY